MTAAELAEQLELMTYGVGAQTPDGTFPLPDKMPTFAPAALLRQAAARLRSMEEALKPFAVEGRAWRHEFEARGDCRIRIGRNDINEHFATGILMSDFVRANAAISGEGQ